VCVCVCVCLGVCVCVCGVMLLTVLIQFIATRLQMDDAPSKNNSDNLIFPITHSCANFFLQFNTFLKTGMISKYPEGYLLAPDIVFAVLVINTL
jgi:hypothetical protein